MKTQLHWQQQLPVVCAVVQPLFKLLLRGSGPDPGVGTFFNNAFDEYNFSIISTNLFGNNNSYALYRAVHRNRKRAKETHHTVIW